MFKGDGTERGRGGLDVCSRVELLVYLIPVCSPFLLMGPLDTYLYASNPQSLLLSFLILPLQLKHTGASSCLASPNVSPKECIDVT